MKFARLFEREEGQVLAFTEYDAETDTTSLRMMTELEGGRVEQKVSFTGDDQEQHATEMLKGLTEEAAFSFHDGYRDLMGG